MKGALTESAAAAMNAGTSQGSNSRQGSGGSGKGGGSGGALASVRESLEHLQAAASSEVAGPGNALAMTLTRLRRSLKPARQLAAALLAHWEQSAPAEENVELAQAATARSCAYLRCTNLGLEGGPAAGQAGSLKCSGCRAAQYCSTACSHADWRAGHRRVCKALAAARQAVKKSAALRQGTG